MKYDNPFPGMNPYLERRHLWPGFHNRLIAILAEELGPKLPGNYRVDIEERVEIEGSFGPPPDLAFMIPDALLTGEPAVRTSRPDAAAARDFLIVIGPAVAVSGRRLRSGFSRWAPC